MEIINEKCISAAEAKQIMKERKKQGEMKYEQKICLEYLEKTQKLTKKQIEDFIAELSKIEILKPRYIVLIINTMPDTEEEVEVIFSKERTNLKKNEIAKIIEIVKKFKK